MHIGISFDQAANMPLDLAYALLSDERLDNTHPVQSNKSNATAAQSNATPKPNNKLNIKSGTTYVSTQRRHSKK